ALRIEIYNALCLAIGVHLDRSGHRARAEIDIAGGQRRRDERGVGARLRADLTAVAAAQRTVGAGCPVSVRLADDSPGGRQRVVAKLAANNVELLGNRMLFERRQRIRFASRLGKRMVDGGARYPELLLCDVVEGGQVLVADWPVRDVCPGDRPELRAHSKVDWLEAIKITAHVHRAAADAVGGPGGIRPAVLAVRTLTDQVWLIP